MKTAAMVGGMFLVLLNLTASALAGECKSDIDCKGDRVCEGGECRSPGGGGGKGGGGETDLPHFCCTDRGRLGPYPNPQGGTTVQVGMSCYGTTPDGQRADGRACK
jgi:hypothetical protein